MEYDPEPPFDAGSPQGAGPEAVALFNEFAAKADDDLRHSVSRVLEQRTAVGSGTTAIQMGS